jgi:hypothetical protein
MLSSKVIGVVIVALSFFAFLLLLKIHAYLKSRKDDKKIEKTKKIDNEK